MRFRDFLKQWNKTSHTEQEQKQLFEGFMVGLGMFAFLYALLMAPDFVFQGYISPHATVVLIVGAVIATWTAVRWQYLEWRKRATAPA